MANPVLVSGASPGDAFYLRYLDNLLQLRAVRRPALGRLLVAEMIEAGKVYQVGAFQPADAAALDGWRYYGRIDRLGGFTQTPPPPPPSPQLVFPQLAL